MYDLLISAHDIQKMQRRLNELGFDAGPVDGIRGRDTNAGIIAFKRSVGLRARPFVGPLTLKALQSVRSNDALAPWYEEARSVLGLHEHRHRPILSKWFDKSVSWIDPREIPWCGAFAATAMRKWQPDIALPDNPLGARNWGRFGQPCTPQVGAVLTFWRGSRSGWKGHVGFYVSESATAYRVLGGNQRNAVTDDTWIGKDRLLHARWPADHPVPNRSVAEVMQGQSLSTNEA